MAAIAWADVVALAAELSTVPAPAQSIVLDHVNTAFSVAKFGGEDSPRLKLVRVLYAAHMATMLTAGGELSAGPITSETASMNSISRSYATVDVSGSDLSLTPYGRQYTALLMVSGGRFPRVL